MTPHMDETQSPRNGASPWTCHRPPCRMLTPGPSPPANPAQTQPQPSEQPHTPAHQEEYTGPCAPSHAMCPPCLLLDLRFLWPDCLLKASDPPHPWPFSGPTTRCPLEQSSQMWAASPVILKQPFVCTPHPQPGSVASPQLSPAVALTWPLPPGSPASPAPWGAQRVGGPWSDQSLHLRVWGGGMAGAARSRVH